MMRARTLCALLGALAVTASAQVYLNATVPISDYVSNGVGTSLTYVYTAPVLDADNNQIGTEYGVGTGVDAENDIFFRWQDTFPDGSIEAVGIGFNSTPGSTYAIVGGTGKYLGATGKVTSTLISGDDPIQTFFNTYTIYTATAATS